MTIQPNFYQLGHYVPLDWMPVEQESACSLFELAGRNGMIKRRRSGYLIVACLFHSHIVSVVPVAWEGCCAPKLKICGEGDEKVHFQAVLQKRK